MQAVCVLQCSTIHKEVSNDREERCTKNKSMVQKENDKKDVFMNNENVKMCRICTKRFVNESNALEPLWKTSEGQCAQSRIYLGGWKTQNRSGKVVGGWIPVLTSEAAYPLSNADRAVDLSSIQCCCMLSCTSVTRMKFAVEPQGLFTGRLRGYVF